MRNKTILRPATTLPVRESGLKGKSDELIPSNSGYRAGIAVVLPSALVSACGGQDPILGTGASAALAPTVTAETPADNVIGVATTTTVTATFSEPMAAITGGATFTLTCAAPCVNPTGTVALDASSRIATFTLTPATTLAPLTRYTATVAGAKSLATGLVLASPFVWHFITAGTADTTRPRVASTTPITTTPGPTAGVATNASIAAIFTKDMAAATLTAAGTFTVTCTSPAYPRPAR